MKKNETRSFVKYEEPQICSISFYVEGVLAASSELDDMKETEGSWMDSLGY